jgi:MFS family permease
MLMAGILFDAGVALTAGAQNIEMLLGGRILLGVAVAFASVSVTLYNSEMAPAQLRGRLNQVFQVQGRAPARSLHSRVHRRARLENGSTLGEVAAGPDLLVPTESGCRSVVQVILTLGVVLAQIINIWAGKFYPWGWRLSLGLAGLPAVVLTIGGIVLPDTPNSLIERGYEDEGLKVHICCFFNIGHYCSSPLLHVIMECTDHYHLMKCILSF